MKPYYQDSAVTIYHGDCEAVLPSIERHDLLLTDPPYGISQDKGMGGGGYDGFGNRTKRNPKVYAGGWDAQKPDDGLITKCLNRADVSIIWGGNFFANALPFQAKWLVWDKEQTMPSYSDAELAWTTISGVSVKMFRQCGAGLASVEKVRFHPTQKPLSLFIWCISLVKDANSILDPFAGSGTTGRAAKDLGKKATLIEREERYCEIAAQRMSQEVLAL
jgi:site-specific DNA-methyltransferase (adenine-specific)